MANNLPLPPGTFVDNDPKVLKTTESGDAHTIHVNVDQLPENLPASLYYLLASLSRPIWMDPATGRLNINSVSSVSNLSLLGGFDARQTQLFATERLNWAQSVRSRVQ